jgi:glycosyltransferase involved in cell wall biosynthesis
MSVYNGMPYLREAVDSILVQTYKNFEFIIVDDASIDGTWMYLRSLKDKQSLRSSRVADLKRIKLIKNKKNIGLALSLNKALRQARGDYIARMDADDISYPGRLKNQLDYMERNRSVDLCGSWVTLINDQGEIVGKNTRNPIGDKEIKKLLGVRPTIIHPTFFAKREFFVKTGGYRDEFDGAEEYDLLCRAKRDFVYANIAKELIYWRLRDTRRSIQMMDKMYKLDIKIKKDKLMRDGISLYGLYGYLKMLVINFLIPLPIKLKIARLLKIA